MQNSNKFLKIAVALLLIANIGLVAMMIWGKNGKGRGHYTRSSDPIEMMAKELGLTEQQKTEQRQMKGEHMKAVKPLMDSLRDAKVNFYMLNKEAQLSDSLLNSYGEMVSAMQVKIDKAMLAHFKKVRASLKSEQQPKFDTLVKKMMQRGRKDTAQKGK
jgi:septal ring factor EnvC (AmiA/AmiB activator)